MRGRSWLLAGVAALLVAAAPPTAAEPRARGVEVARQQGARRLGAPAARLVVRGPEVVRFAVSRRVAHVYDVEDPAVRRTTRVVLDEQGHEVDLPGLHAEEARARRAEYGAMDPGLVTHLAEAPAGKPLALLIWLAPPPAPVARRPADEALTADKVDVIVARSHRQLDPVYRHLAEPVVHRLQGLGHPARHLAGPYLVANLPPEVARRVAHWPEIRGMALSRRLRWPRYDFPLLQPRRR